jgi:hypothetical protein
MAVNTMLSPGTFAGEPSLTAPLESEIEKILSSKNVYLAEPGSVTSGDGIYYNFQNSVIDIAETTRNIGRYKVSLNQLSFGGTSQFTVPNQSFLSSIWLTLTLPNIPANVFLPRGWSLDAVEEVSYLLGSSNVSQLKINGDSHTDIMLEHCETSEKKSRLIHLAGEEITAPTTTESRATFQLQLPWSCINALTKKFTFDTNILNSPINVIIKWRPRDQIMSGTGVLASGITQFSTGTVYADQLDLTNKSLSLKMKMLMSPQLSYSYPFIFTQSYTLPFTGNTTLPISLNLLGIINADLVALNFHAVKNDRLHTGPTYNNRMNRMDYDEIRDVHLQFNGLTMYDAPGDSWKAYAMQDNIGDPEFQQSRLTGPQGTSPFVTEPIDRMAVFVPFTFNKSTLFTNAFSNTWRIPNNTLVLSFLTSDTGDYTLYLTYYYNSVFSIRQGNSSLLLE